MQTLEEITDEAVYQAYQVKKPALVARVTDLIKQGETPAQIESAMVASFGRDEITRAVRHIAEHVARTNN